METNDSKRLLSEFPIHTYEAWKEAAIQLLKGRSFEKTLVSPTYEGFDLQPIYTREVLDRLPHTQDLPGFGSLVRGSRPEGYLEGGWLVSQELTASTPAALNAIALKELENGQNELNIWLDEASRGAVDADSSSARHVGICGVSLSTVGDLKTLLKDIHPEMISLYFQSGQAAPALYPLLVAALRDMSEDTAEIRGCLGMDPIGSLVESGSLAGEPEALFDAMEATVRHAALALPKLQIIDVKGHVYHNGGASSTQEMAAVLATAVAYIKALVERGIPATEIVSRMRLSVSVGGNYFLEIAKFRALRLVWSRVMEALEVPVESRSVHLHARTGLWNKTVLDPYVNMLRTTTEAFSAVVAGCDSLHVGPFDEVIRESDAFSRRLARNTHAILGEECGLREVVDPAGGSWAVEALTDQMAAEAWKRFQEIEAEGGILSSLESGRLQQSVEAARLERAKNIQRRKDVIVGTNAYPNSTEQVLKPTGTDYAAAAKQRTLALEEWKSGRNEAVLKAALEAALSKKGEARVEALVSAAASGATISELQAASGLGTSEIRVDPIRLQRAAGEFEALRFAARALKESGTAPVVHQLNMGPSRRYRIRADWTSAFFQVGGLDVLNKDDYADTAEALEALGKSAAKVAIITSDDETYVETVEKLAKGIKELNPATRVLVAGAPGEHEAAWRTAGVDDFVNVRVNNYAFNRNLLESMGASL